jgi:hypothetical protein
LKVFALEVSTAGSGEEDKSATHFAGSFKLIDKLLELINEVTDKMFEEGKKLKRIKLNGKDFTGSKAEYIAIIKEEKNSQYIKMNNPGKTKAFNKLKAMTKLANRDYDIIAVAIHGAAYETGTPANQIAYGNNEYQNQKKAIEEIRNTGRPTTGKYTIVSCYRTWPGQGDPKDYEEAFNTTAAGGNVSFGGRIIIKGAKKTFVKESCAISFETIGVYKSIGGKRQKGDAQYETYSE